MKKTTTGFTIVELLIVIVVIAIIATISIVAYTGVQSRARDSKRTSDIASIVKALEAYKILNGGYPLASSASGPAEYEVSGTEPAGTFMEYLTPDFFGRVPLDPINDSTHYYRYFNYAAGSANCPLARGRFITFEVIGFEKAANMPKSDDPLVCPNRTWAGGSTTYFTYKFENG